MHLHRLHKGVVYISNSISLGSLQKFEGAVEESKLVMGSWLHLISRPENEHFQENEWIFSLLYIQYIQYIDKVYGCYAFLFSSNLDINCGLHEKIRHPKILRCQFLAPSF